MKILKKIFNGQPTSSDQFNAVIDVVNLLLKTETERLSRQCGGIRYEPRLHDEIINKYPSMFEDEK